VSCEQRKTKILIINEATFRYNYSLQLYKYLTLFLHFIHAWFCGLYKAFIHYRRFKLVLIAGILCIAFSKRGCVTSNVWKSGQEMSKCVQVIRMFLTVSVLISQESVKSRQIRDARPKTGQMGVPGGLWFFPGLEVKNRDCPGKSGTDGHLSRNTNPNRNRPTTPVLTLTEPLTSK